MSRHFLLRLARAIRERGVPVMVRYAHRKYIRPINAVGVAILTLSMLLMLGSLGNALLARDWVEVAVDLFTVAILADWAKDRLHKARGVTPESKTPDFSNLIRLIVEAGQVEKVIRIFGPFVGRSRLAAELLRQIAAAQAEAEEAGDGEA